MCRARILSISISFDNDQYEAYSIGPKKGRKDVRKCNQEPPVSIGRSTTITHVFIGIPCSYLNISSGSGARFLHLGGAALRSTRTSIFSLNKSCSMGRVFGSCLLVNRIERSGSEIGCVRVEGKCRLGSRNPGPFPISRKRACGSIGISVALILHFPTNGSDGGKPIVP